MTTELKNRFTRLDQSAIYIVGKLEGLSSTTRYEISDEVREEIRSIARELAEEIKFFQ